VTATIALVLAFAVAVGAAEARGDSTLPTSTEPVSGITFVRLPAGEFWMGSPEDEPDREAQEVRHRVRISRPFEIGRTEVTQVQWLRVMGTSPSRSSECGPDCPVEQVSWNDVQRFLARLGELAGESFRLPTEAEWEYACRAGTTSAFATGATLGRDQANFDERVPVPGEPAGAPYGAPTPVASFPPNAWGLYDLHGNVWEWTADEHCPYPEDGVAVDPLGACGAELKVIRGGSWRFGADSARCALRYTHRPEDDGPSLGFRVARDVAATPSAGSPSP